MAHGGRRKPSILKLQDSVNEILRWTKKLAVAKNVCQPTSLVYYILKSQEYKTNFKGWLKVIAQEKDAFVKKNLFEDQRINATLVVFKLRKVYVFFKSYSKICFIS